jgi:hypothetical protein
MGCVPAVITDAVEEQDNQFYLIFHIAQYIMLRLEEGFKDFLQTIESICVQELEQFML